jgi:hypothetical protein
MLCRATLLMVTYFTAPGIQATYIVAAALSFAVKMKTHAVSDRMADLARTHAGIVDQYEITWPASPDILRPVTIGSAIEVCPRRSRADGSDGFPIPGGRVRDDRALRMGRLPATMQPVYPEFGLSLSSTPAASSGSGGRTS